MNVHPMPTPKKVLRVNGANGDLLIVFPCVLHGSHVVVGGGEPGGVATALHLHVDEAMALVEMLNAGATWPNLTDYPDGFRQGSVLCRGGLFGATMRAGVFYFSWKVGPLPLGVVPLTDQGRAELAAAVLELLHGKAAAA